MKIIAMVPLLVTLALSACRPQEAKFKTETLAPSAVEKTAGRFQIAQGEYELLTTVPLPPESLRKKALFRIDTKTGKAWIFVCSYTEGKGVYQNWVPIQDDLPVE